MKGRDYRVFVGDFETTVYDGQEDTEVWAAACVELYSEDVKIYHSIEDLFKFLSSDGENNIICYFHNLKFDGSFWLNYIIKVLKYKQAYTQTNANDFNTIKWIDDDDMKPETFKYMISSKGQWYSIIIRTYNRFIELRDSMKLLPFSVKAIGNSFKTKHQKLDMEYTGYRYAGCEITPEEQEYIANDVFVVKEALEIMYDEGHTRSTIGSCCLAEFKTEYSKDEYDDNFPNQYEIEINNRQFGAPTVGDYVHNSYRGGWCYLVKGKENKLYGRGITCDVNSLYPSMMSSESGNVYPYGKPEFWTGNYIPDICERSDIYYFIRLRTRFYIKKNHLPFIQIKHSLYYRSTEMLETSDVYDGETGEYVSEFIDTDGTYHNTIVEMTMTQTDYALFREHYDVVDFEILDGCYYNAKSGFFDEYIDKYKKIKMTSKGAKRTLAKLYLNNLYGKMASSPDSSFKVASIKDVGSLGFETVRERDKIPGYIPIGSAITSYARNFTIRAAQKNYYGVDKAGFIYADTDSIHCDISPDDINGLVIHPTNFNAWAIESTWDKAIFVRQKTYIEHVIEEDLEPIEQPYHNVKCAGMPSKCKNLLALSIDGYEENENDEYTQEEKDFLSVKRDYEDFKIGLKVPGKLMPKQIPGGVLLVETTYEMRNLIKWF